VDCCTTGWSPSFRLALGIFAETEMLLQNGAVTCVVIQPQGKIVETVTST